MTQHWWDRFRFGRSDILETPPTPEHVAGLLESERQSQLQHRLLPINPLLSTRISISREDVDSWRDTREELRRMGLLHLVNNPREEEEKIKAYIETLKRDISEGTGINQETLFGSNNSPEEQAMIRESNRLAIENPSERSLEESNEAADYVNAFTRAVQTLRRAGHNTPMSLTGATRSPTSQTLEEFFNSMHELHRAIVPLTEVFTEAIAPLMEAISPAMDIAIDNRSIGTQELCSRIEAAHLRTIPEIYYSGVQEEYIIFFGGGRHEDNDVRVQGDFLYTISFGIMKLKEKGCDASRFNIFTNRKLHDIAENNPHIYRGSSVCERERIIYRNEVNCWITDENLPDVIIIKPLPTTPPGNIRIPLMVAITGILNCGSSNQVTGIANHQVDIVVPVRNGRGGPVVGSAIIGTPRVEGSVLDGPVVRARWVDGRGMAPERGTVRTIDLEDVVSIVTPQMTEMEEAISKLKIVERECWLCGNSINYKECCEANPSMTHNEVSALWNNKIAKIACCNCTDTMGKMVNLLKKSSVEYISVSKDTKTKYLVKEDRFVNYSKTSRIVFEFTTGGRISFKKIQFENLMKYKIIDFPIELEDDVLEPDGEREWKVENRRTEDSAVVR